MVRTLSPTKRRHLKKSSISVSDLNNDSQRGPEHRNQRQEQVPYSHTLSHLREERNVRNEEIIDSAHHFPFSNGPNVPAPMAAPSISQVQENFCSRRSEGSLIRRRRDNDYATRNEMGSLLGERVELDVTQLMRGAGGMNTDDFLNTPSGALYSRRAQNASLLLPFGRHRLTTSLMGITPDEGRRGGLTMKSITPLNSSMLALNHGLHFRPMSYTSSDSTVNRNGEEFDASALSRWRWDDRRLDDELALSMRYGGSMQPSVWRRRGDQDHYFRHQFSSEGLVPSILAQHQNTEASPPARRTILLHPHVQDDRAGLPPSSSTLTESLLRDRNTATSSFYHSFPSSTARAVETSWQGGSMSTCGARTTTTSLDGGRSNSSTRAHLAMEGGPQRFPTHRKSVSGFARRLSEAGNHHFSDRLCVPLATDEDQNWLSEFLCFVRSDLVEIFRANEQDVRSRKSSKKVVYGQVGIRCRYCAHLPPSGRANRSSSYPFTLSRIYQSLTMMLRDHFGACTAIPAPIKECFFLLKGKTSQGATGSNNFWEYSAKKLGLVDSESGIWVDESAESIGTSVYGAKLTVPHAIVGIPNASRTSSFGRVVQLVFPEDRTLVSDFLYVLMTHAQLVHMEESERIGNRKNLQVGLAGIGCRYCCQSNRKGLCRIFPARRRTLPNKVHDLYEHVRRCTLCPKESRDSLVFLKNLDDGHKNEARMMVGEKDFFDRVWARMGYDDSDAES